MSSDSSQIKKICKPGIILGLNEHFITFKLPRSENIKCWLLIYKQVKHYQYIHMNIARMKYLISPMCIGISGLENFCSVTYSFLTNWQPEDNILIVNMSIYKICRRVMV